MTNHQAVLARIARQLSNDLNLDTVLGPILRMLAEETGLARVALSRVDWVSEEVVILAGHGLTPAEVRRGRYAFGEGIIGRVVQSGQARVVPSIAAEPHFLDRTGALTEGTDRAFICVPILLDGQVVGALSAYRSPAPPDELGVDLDLLAILAGLTAPAVQQIATPQRVSTHHNSPWRPPHMIGSSRVMMSVYELIDQVAGSPTTVMLRGESGTGKELVAQAIHGHSPRRRAPFIKVNCAALPENLIESELFGHERGAFTGAHQQRKGRFELAHGGTLFLDEIGDLSPATQIKLLRVLQEREFERVGGNRTVRVDVRLVTATSCDLESMMDDGTFRNDLYYRLNIFPVHMPSLRERKADILQLADHFIGAFNLAHGKQVLRISTPAIDMLASYHWPGNVRELENCIERAILLTRSEVLHAHHLPPSLQTADATRDGAPAGLKAQLATVERELIFDALKHVRGNMAAAARALQITERQMGLRVARYQIDTQTFR